MKVFRNKDLALTPMIFRILEAAGTRSVAPTLVLNFPSRVVFGNGDTSASPNLGILSHRAGWVSVMVNTG